MSGLLASEWRVAAVLQRAQLQATIDLLDAGEGRACVRIYSTARPSVLGAQDEAMLEIALAKPCASIDVNGYLVLQPADAGGTLVLTEGTPRWGELVAADGTVVIDGGVTDVDHGGCFQVSGAATPEGDDSPLFYAGVLLMLAPTALA